MVFKSVNNKSTINNMKNIKNILLGLGSVVTLISSCAGGNANLTESGLDPAKFDTIINNKKCSCTYSRTRKQKYV